MLRFVISFSLTVLICAMGVFGFLDSYWPLLAFSVGFLSWALGAPRRKKTLVASGKFQGQATLNTLQAKLQEVKASCVRLDLESAQKASDCLQKAQTCLLALQMAQAAGTSEALLERKVSRALMEYFPDSLALILNMSTTSDELKAPAKAEFAKQMDALAVEFSEIEQVLMSSQLTKSKVQTGFLNEKFSGIKTH